MRILHEITTLAYPIKLYQCSGKNRFAVGYGQQFNTDLTREQAAAEFGQCVFHALQCEGKLRD